MAERKHCREQCSEENLTESNVQKKTLQQCPKEKTIKNNVHKNALQRTISKAEHYSENTQA